MSPVTGVGVVAVVVDVRFARGRDQLDVADEVPVAV